MPIDVRGPDGTIYRVNTDDEQEARRTVRSHLARQQQEGDARASSGDPRQPGSIIGNIAGRAARPESAMMRTPFAQNLVRRAHERAPQGAPGSFTRALEDFNRSGPTEMLSQMFRNIGVADEIAGASEFLQSGGNAEAARAGAQYENERRDQVAREQPILNATSIAASVPAFAGAPAAAGPVSMLQAGLGAAGTNAPFALARQEGSLQERLPGAAVETAIVGGLGAGLQGAANFLTRPRPPSSASARAGLFDRAGVRPTAAAVTAPEPPQGTPVTADPGRTAVVSRAIAENPVVGFIPMGHMRRSLGDTAARAEQLARAFGPRQGPEAAGAQLQEGLHRFAFGTDAGAAPPQGAMRNWSFDQRSNQLYSRWWKKFNRALSTWASRGQQAPQAMTDETRIVLDDIFGRNTSEVAQEVNDPLLGRLRQLVSGQRQGGTAGAGRTFQDIRDIRTYVRQLQRSDPSTRPTLSDGNLQRIEQALTSDMYASAVFVGGQPLARELRNIDRYYRTGSQRINTVLRPFLREGETPAAAYNRVIAAATAGGRQNTRLLRSVRQSLQPDEWRQIASTTIDELGRAGRGHPYAAEGAFSVEQFASRYNAMSADGRRALFGDLGSLQGAPAGGSFIDLERALNDLARVAGMQKAVERAANTSNTAVAGQAVGTVTGIVTAPQVTIPALFALGITGEMLTNPAFVRWIVSAPRAAGGVGGMRRSVAELGRIAGRDPAIAPYYAEFARGLGDQAHPEAEGSPSQGYQPAPSTEYSQ